MTTTCIAAALGVISCTVAPGSTISPAEAARILAPYQFVYVANVPPRSADERIFVAATGTEPPARLPDRRLDGTFLSAPAMVYGQPYGWLGGWPGAWPMRGMGRAGTSAVPAPGRAGGSRRPLRR